MLPCPHCQQQLTQVKSLHGMFWGCSRCGGRAVTLPVLRRHISTKHVRALWREAREHGRQGRACPICTRAMAEFVPAGGAHELDVCPNCHLVWFDPDEFEAATAAAPPVEEPAPPRRVAAAASPEARAALGRELVAKERLAMQTRRHQAGGSTATPDEWWKYGLALCGVPVETESQKLDRLPLVTWAIGAAMVVTAIATFGDLQGYVNDFGLLPADPWRWGGITFVTSFFLHGGIAHLLGNLYFLITFGDNVEDHIGHGWQLLLIIVAALAGDLLHMAIDPQGALPMVGASGGISGLIVFYACAFPRARLGLFFWIYFFPKWISLSAVWFVGFWIALQLVGVYLQISGASSVSALAHLGGAGVGVLCYFLKGR